MKHIYSLDRWLIAKPYQGLIDLTGRKREWWVEQCAFLILVSGVADALLNATDGWKQATMAGLAMLLAFLVWLDSRVPLFLEMVAAAVRTRILVLFGVALTTPGCFVRDAWLPPLLFGVGLVSAYYFAACGPPKPREPRTKMQPEGAA